MESPSSTPNLDDTSERQAALRRYHVLDTAPEKNFDRITSMITKICDVPTALISLIDEERQWFKSCFGFNRRETDIEVSFCVHAVDAGRTLVVEDATEDPRFKDNPIVTGPPHIRFYAGAPLTTPDGIHIGTLCIIDYEARTFDAAQREILEDLADTVVAQFELRSAEAQIRQLIEENPQPMYVHAAADGALLDANAAARDLYGYDASTLSDLTTADLEGPDSVQPSSGTYTMHEQADGTLVPVRVQEHEVLYNGWEACLAVPQRLPADTDTTAFVQLDTEGIVQSASPDWEALTDTPAASAVGQPLADLVVPSDAPALNTALTELWEDAAAPLRLVTALQVDGGRQPVLVTGRLVRDGTGAAAGIAATLTPVPEAQHTPAPDDADDGGSYTAFASKLPTFNDPDEAPLSADGASDPVEAPVPSTDERASEAGAESDSEASHTISPSPFDLTEHLRALTHERTSSHQRLNVSPSLPDDAVPVRLDPEVVTEIVGSLLDNACAHTEEGFVSLQMDADDDAVQISIVDSGTGVEERFMHVYMDAADGTPSALEHVHDLTNRIGGALSMEESDDGTRFRLTLPRSVTSNGPHS
jgi:GAF domain-containing protein